MDYKSLTPGEIKLIQESFAKVCDNSNITAKLLYDKLFEARPEIAKIFKGDMHEQEAKLMHMMKTVVNGLNNPQILVPSIQDLGKKHYDFGVIPVHYEKFREALFYSLEMQLAGDFDKESRDAWQKLYDILAETMQGLQYK